MAVLVIQEETCLGGKAEGEDVLDGVVGGNAGGGLEAVDGG